MRPHSSNPWTEVETARLRELVEQGLSRAELGIALGRTTRSIEYRVRASKLAIRYLRPWTAEELNTAHSMVEAGHSDAEIAAALDRTRMAVSSALHRERAAAGVRRHTRWTPEETRRAVELNGSGVRRAEIARRLGRTTSSVHSRLRALRMPSPLGRGRPPRSASLVGIDLIDTDEL